MNIQKYLKSIAVGDVVVVLCAPSAVLQVTQVIGKTLVTDQGVCFSRVTGGALGVSMSLCIQPPFVCAGGCAPRSPVCPYGVLLYQEAARLASLIEGGSLSSYETSVTLDAWYSLGDLWLFHCGESVGDGVPDHWATCVGGME